MNEDFLSIGNDIDLLDRAAADGFPPDAAQERGDGSISADGSLGPPAPTAAGTLSCPTQTLKHGDTFLVLDAFGDAQALQVGAEGLFHRDTRFLSRLVLLVDGQRPSLRNSRISDDNVVLSVELTNPDRIRRSGSDSETIPGATLPTGAVEIRRSKALAARTCYEEISIRNRSAEAVALELSLAVEADFADIFEVRGSERRRRGRSLPPEHTAGGVLLSYVGLDGVRRETRIACDPAPDAAAANGEQSTLVWPLRLSPGEIAGIHIAIRCDVGDADRLPSHGPGIASPTRLSDAVDVVRGWIGRRADKTARIRSSNTDFNAWLDRSRADLDMLLTEEASDDPVPYAGVPWFNTLFGRDAIVTALQTLWLDPSIARGTLRRLALLQAAAIDPSRDAEPGKILHEVRRGEMAVLREVPLDRYYGAVDATPLFVVLAAAYFERTGDLDLVQDLWPNIEAALSWVEHHGDADGDGFVEYGRKADGGLANQGWKDSWDAIFHADGRLAEGAIALCEVQGYVYAALRGAAAMANAIARPDCATACAARAALLRERFDAAFWCDDLGTYALALDGAKRPCRVRASNAGHALWSGIAYPERATRVVQTLMDDRSFCGWGVRTVAAGEARYDPTSYHNGSVWPHDNSLIALGFSRYGFHAEAARITSGVFAASRFLDRRRLPELFCGFDRAKGEGPVAYANACAPQAWAAAVPFALLAGCLGVSFDRRAGRLALQGPAALPDCLDEMRISNVRLEGAGGPRYVNLVVRRRPDDGSVGVQLVNQTGRIGMERAGRADRP